MRPEIQRLSRFVRSCRHAAVVLPVLALAQQSPVGTQIAIRLKSSVSTRASRTADPVVIARVRADRRTVIPVRAVVGGTVEKVAQSSAAGERVASPDSRPAAPSGRS